MFTHLVTRSALGFTLLTASAFLAPHSAAAQRPVTFGIGAGTSAPVGDLDVLAKGGFQLLGNVEFRPAVLPLGIRFDVAWNRFGIDGEDIVKGNVSSYSFTANAIGTIPSKTAGKVYLLGGGGVYHLRVKSESGDIEELEGEAKETKFGINAGAGLDIPVGGLRMFIEARYHHIFADGTAIKFIPVTAGFRF